MDYYVDATGAIHSGPCPQGCIPCEDGDPTFLAALAAQQNADTLAAQQAAARLKLDKADVSALRALKQGIPIPAAWTAYEASLRTVTVQGGALPANPAAFPDGTTVPSSW